MSDIAQLQRDHFPGRTYRDIARADGEQLPPVIECQSNPDQSTEDIPFERYTSRAFFDREMRQMWRKVWQFACRDEHVREVGDYYVYDIARFSLVIVRTDEGLRAYHSSCLHRGTKLKPSRSNGWSGSIQCPFHGWQWNLDGTIRHIPCDWEFPQLDRAKACLPQAASKAGTASSSSISIARRLPSSTISRCCQSISRGGTCPTGTSTPMFRSGCRAIGSSRRKPSWKPITRLLRTRK